MGFQEVLQMYTTELPGMNYAANTGKKSKFLERCVTNGYFSSYFSFFFFSLHVYNVSLVVLLLVHFYYVFNRTHKFVYLFLLAYFNLVLMYFFWCFLGRLKGVRTFDFLIIYFCRKYRTLLMKSASVGNSGKVHIFAR